MNKLEESLDLLERIEDYKSYKNVLDQKIDELLEEYGFKCVKERKKGILLYAKDGEIFAKLGDEEYCWAKPNLLKKELNYKKVYNSLKKASMPSGFQFLSVMGAWLGTMVLGGVGFDYLLDINNRGLESLSNGNNIVFTIAMAGLTGSSMTLYFLLGLEYLVKRNKKKFEKSCEEIFYGKEALEKAFRR